MHSLLRGPLTLALAFALAFACASPSLARAQTLRVDGTTITLGGVHRYDAVEVVRGGRIVVPPFDGTDRAGTGNLVLVAGRILVDSTSSIDARGAGYQPLTCGDGRGPAAVPLSGGRGGCSVRDSGGGGGHFGRGGRGTKDCFIFGPATSCQFPQEFEESCGSLAASGADGVGPRKGTGVVTLMSKTTGRVRERSNAYHPRRFAKLFGYWSGAYSPRPKFAAAVAMPPPRSDVA